MTIIPWPVSAVDEPHLRQLARRLHRFAAADPELDPVSVGAGLAGAPGRPRRAVIVGDRSELLGGLDALAAGADDLCLVSGQAGASPVRTAFVYPGHGGQWPGMAAELLDSSPVFARRMSDCADALAPYVDWSPADVLRGSGAALEAGAPEVVQPLLFAVMVSLTALWEAHGVTPDAVIGHSVGEVTAAHVAGALSLEDAARAIALCSRAQVRLQGTGELASVMASPAVMGDRLARWRGRIVIAGASGPATVVISGDRDAMAEEVAALNADGISARLIPLGVPVHASHVDELREELSRIPVSPGPLAARVPLYSSLSGGRVTTPLGPGYWFRMLREPFSFDAAVRAALGDGFNLFLEVGPHPVLAGGLADTADAQGARDVAVASTLRRGAGNLRYFYAQAAELFVRGAAVSWDSAYGATSPADLPDELFESPDDLGEVATAAGPAPRGSFPAWPAKSAAARCCGLSGRRRRWSPAFPVPTHPVITRPSTKPDSTRPPRSSCAPGSAARPGCRFRRR